MSDKDLIKLGSATAKGGFRNEDDIVAKFNNWEKDEDAQKWLEIMGYPINEIEKVEAIKLHGYKTDVQVQITGELSRKPMTLVTGSVKGMIEKLKEEK